MSLGNRLIKRMTKYTAILSQLYKTNVIFVAKEYKEDLGHHNMAVSLACDMDNMDESYLNLRDLLKSIEHTVNEETEFKMTVNLARRK